MTGQARRIGVLQHLAHKRWGTVLPPPSCLHLPPFHLAVAHSALLLSPLAASSTHHGQAIMAVWEMAEFELRRLREELTAKDAELRELWGKTSDTLLHHQRENDELRKCLESMTEQLQEAKATMEAVMDRLGSEVDSMARRLEHKRTKRDEVEERLGHALADLAAQVELLRIIYH